MKAPKKRAALARFLNRHVDQVEPSPLLRTLQMSRVQVWKDVRADPEKEEANGIRADAARPLLMVAAPP